MNVPNPIIVDAAGTAGSGYVLKAYLTGGTISTSIAIAAAGTSPQTTITANSEGKWEVSGNEILPYIDRKHKWGIFANATDATANTPFYMGPFDNVEQVANSSDTVKTFSTLALAVAATTIVDGDALNIAERTTGNGGGADWYVELLSVGAANTYNRVAWGANTGAATDLVLVLRNSETGNVKQWGATGDGTTDDYAALQYLVSNNDNMFFPDTATYMVGTTIREASNAGSRTVRGENRVRTVVKATSTLATSGEPIFWFGNSSGHGNYRLYFDEIALNGGDEAGDGAAGAIALRAHECGTSYAGNMTVRGALMGIQAIGCIGSSWGGEKSEFYTSQQGIVQQRAQGGGVGLDPDDIINTESPPNLNSNSSVIQNCWFAGIKKNVVRIIGGLVNLRDCTFQANGDGATIDLVHIIDGNEAQDFGGGSSVERCWFEGGTSRSYIHVDSTRGAFISGNFLSGVTTATEVGILVDNTSPGVQIVGNSFRGTWSATLSDGRSTNASYYIDSTNRFAYCSSNYHTDATVNPFIDYSIFNHRHIVMENHNNSGIDRGLSVGNISIRNDVIQLNPDQSVLGTYHIEDPILDRPDVLGGFTFETTTTTALEDRNNAVNVTNKRTNMLLLNSTTGLVVRASSGTTTATWRNLADGVSTHTPVGTTIALTGTAASTIDESDVVTGGKTIILTLTSDTFIAAGTGPIGTTAQTQAIIDGITSAQTETLGWNTEVRDKEVTTAVVRTSSTIATITLTAAAAYDITAQETITATVPAAVLVTSASDVICAPTFTVDTV